MSGTRPSRTFRVAAAVGVCCYVLAAACGMYVLSGGLSPFLQVCLWGVHGVVLALLLRRLGPTETALGAALLAVVVSAAAGHVAGLAREDIALRQRGEQVAVTVVEERPGPAEGRKGRHSSYTLERAEDGSTVPGEMETTSDLYDVGRRLTVLVDPEGEVRPRTPGQADPAAELAGAAGLILVAVAAVGWVAWRGRWREGGGGSALAAGVAGQPGTADQEARLRELLRTGPADRRGYIRVHPQDYPHLTQQRAARIAWETGLRAEAFGNRGSWRFAETVVEEIPHDP
ncbi:hypothetical protein [Streptomyces albidoflavus]|uniref:hypothetical protein n=1 Tax=Streptomyces albidoflavus TaxID=1886 RepID=UPI0033AD619B